MARLPALDTSGLQTVARSWETRASIAMEKGARDRAALNRIGTTIAGTLERNEDLARADRMRREDIARNERRWEEDRRMRLDERQFDRDKTVLSILDRRIQDRTTSAGSTLMEPDIDPMTGLPNEGKAQRLAKIEAENAEDLSKRDLILQRFMANPARQTALGSTADTAEEMPGIRQYNAAVSGVLDRSRAAEADASKGPEARAYAAPASPAAPAATGAVPAADWTSRFTPTGDPEIDKATTAYADHARREAEALAQRDLLNRKAADLDKMPKPKDVPAWAARVAEKQRLLDAALVAAKEAKFEGDMKDLSQADRNAAMQRRAGEESVRRTLAMTAEREPAQASAEDIAATKAYAAKAGMPWLGPTLSKRDAEERMADLDRQRAEKRADERTAKSDTRADARDTRAEEANRRAEEANARAAEAAKRAAEKPEKDDIEKDLDFAKDHLALMNETLKSMVDSVTGIREGFTKEEVEKARKDVREATAEYDKAHAAFKKRRTATATPDEASSGVPDAVKALVPKSFKTKAAAKSWLEANSAGLSAEEKAMLEDLVVGRIGR